MKNLAFITAADAAAGFSLAGFCQLVATADQVKEILLKLVDNPDFGLIVIDERLINDRLEEEIRLVEETWPGLVVLLPAPAARPGAGDYAARLLHRTIGYQQQL